MYCSALKQGNLKRAYHQLSGGFLVNEDDVSVVKTVELAYDVVFLVRDNWLDETWFEVLGFSEELGPSGLDTGSVSLDLVDLTDEVHVSAVLAVVADLLESLRVNVSKDVSEGAEGVLEHIVPVVFGEVDDDWNQDRESLTLVVLKD